MTKIKINYPNDYDSEIDYQAAISRCGDDEQSILDELAEVATNSGLNFIQSTDFGAIWEGTEESIDICKNNLPDWAKNYTSIIEE